MDQHMDITYVAILYNQQHQLDPVPEDREPKGVVQCVPVLDPAPEPVNRPQPIYGAIPSARPSRHVRQTPCCLDSLTLILLYAKG